MYDVFISYNKDDKAIADGLCHFIEQNKLKCWIAPRDILPGVEWAAAIDKAISKASVFVVIVSNNSVKSNQIPREITLAVNLGLPIIPFKIDDVNLFGSWRYNLASCHWIDVSSGSIEQMYLHATKAILALIKGQDVICYNDIYTQPIPQIDMRAFRSFANCGMEQTIFKIKKNISGNELSVSANFEPTRLRPEIPEFAGIYYILKMPIKAVKSNKLYFKASSQDESIAEIAVEIKPAGKLWMHESFPIELTSQEAEYEIDFNDFTDTRTLNCIEEITFVIFRTSFSDEDHLKGKFDISCVRFE